MQKQSTKSLYDYWNTLRGSRSAPDRRDLDPTKIRGALANTFILELNDSQEFDFRSPRQVIKPPPKSDACFLRPQELSKPRQRRSSLRGR